MYLFDLFFISVESIGEKKVQLTRRIEELSGNRSDTEIKVLFVICSEDKILRQMNGKLMG